jgi:CheY-like chemotaxis protein/HPt (histidine-containing phosphotransfer) domain-containing protein
LRLFHITAETATSGKEAIEHVQKKHYDIVFMDLRMPEMSGVDTTKLIREMGINIPVIALTASAVIGAKEMMLEAGMNDYLWKPIVKTELVHMLKKWIPAEKLLDPSQEKNVSDNEETDEEHKEFWEKVNQIEEIDLQTGLDRVDDQKDVYEKSLEFMIKEIEKCERNLGEFLSANNLQQFSIAAHGMKGSLANIGAMELSKEAYTLEKAADKMDNNFCVKNLPSFLTELNELCEKLKEAFSLICQNNGSIEIPAELSSIYKRLLKAFGDFNLQRIEKEMEAINEMHLSGALKEEIDKIKDAVMLMDFDSAAELIKDAA